MAEKVAKLGVEREKDFMYYVKDGEVWKVQRKQPGVPKGRPEKVADGGFEVDTNYIYFVDRDGDVARAKRAVGGQKRKKKAAKRRAAPRKAASRGKKASKKKAPKKAAKKSAKGGKKAKKKGRRKADLPTAIRLQKGRRPIAGGLFFSSASPAGAPERASRAGPSAERRGSAAPASI